MSFYSVNSTNIAPIAYGTVTPTPSGSSLPAPITNSYGTIGNAIWDVTPGQGGWVITLTGSYNKINALGCIVFPDNSVFLGSPTIYSGTHTTSNIKMVTGKTSSSTNTTFIYGDTYEFQFVVFGSP